MASQLARTVHALDRIADEDEEIALIDALGPDGVELLSLVSDALREELALRSPA